MKITLCGSTRFMDQFREAEINLTLQGHVIYSVATSVKGDFQPTGDQKLLLDMVHLSKIEESDCIVVIGRQPNGTTYIGESTRHEIMYAAVRDKSIYFYRGDLGEGLKEFNSAIKIAAITDVEREQERKEAEQKRQEFFSQFGIGSQEEPPRTN